MSSIVSYDLKLLNLFLSPNWNIVLSQGCLISLMAVLYALEYFKSTGEWQYIRITMKFVAMRFEILQ